MGKVENKKKAKVVDAETEAAEKKESGSEEMLKTRFVADVTKDAADDTDDFESFYLRQVTEEFADDIEKLRNAPDFKESSLPVLIQALKQPVGNITGKIPEHQAARDNL